jgi:hypothetical protein
MSFVIRFTSLVNINLESHSNSYLKYYDPDGYNGHGKFEITNKPLLHCCMYK